MHHISACPDSSPESRRTRCLRHGNSVISCDLLPFQEALMIQWPRLEERDIQQAGRNRQVLAEIIGRKYGVAPAFVESYLKNLEYTLEHTLAA